MRSILKRLLLSAAFLAAPLLAALLAEPARLADDRRETAVTRASIRVPSDGKDQSRLVRIPPEERFDAGRFDLASRVSPATAPSAAADDPIEPFEMEPPIEGFADCICEGPALLLPARLAVPEPMPAATGAQKAAWADLEQAARASLASLEDLCGAEPPSFAPDDPIEALRTRAHAAAALAAALSRYRAAAEMVIAVHSSERTHRLAESTQVAPEPVP